MREIVLARKSPSDANPLFFLLQNTLLLMYSQRSTLAENKPRIRFVMRLLLGAQLRSLAELSNLRTASPAHFPEHWAKNDPEIVHF